MEKVHRQGKLQWQLEQEVPLVSRARLSCHPCALHQSGQSVAEAKQQEQWQLEAQPVRQVVACQASPGELRLVLPPHAIDQFRRRQRLSLHQRLYRQVDRFVRLLHREVDPLAPVKNLWRQQISPLTPRALHHRQSAVW